MITYDSLMNQANLRGMPAGKMRGLLREYLQVLILKALYQSKYGNLFYFTGGTYLRLVHGLKRFSEDLDFNGRNLKQALFEEVVQKIVSELERVGIAAKTEFVHWQNIFAANLLFPDIEKTYQAISQHSKKEGMSIKFEMNQPQWEIQKETGVVSGFAEVFPLLCTDKGALFADKIDALNKKMRARHLYDIIFMLSNAYPIDTKITKFYGIEGNPLDALIQRVGKYTEKELNMLAKQIQPFLFDEKEIDLILSCKKILPELIKRNYKNIVQ